MTTLNARLPYPARKAEVPRIVVELGHEPAIELAGRRQESRERLRIPMRWLLGVALTGLIGGALIGSTLYLDLDSKSNFAEPPEFVAPPRHETAERESVNPGKGDRLARPIDIVAAKQSYKVSMTMKVGDKQVIESRPFTLLSTTLTTTPTAFADAVPPFDPLKIGSSGNEKADAPQDLELRPGDPEAGFTSRDISAAEIAEVEGELSPGEAQAQARDWLRAQNSSQRLPALAPQMMLMRASHAGVDPLGGLSYANVGAIESNSPFSSIEVRLVPENVTNIPRATQDPEPNSGRERLVVLHHGESLEDLLRANGASRDSASAIRAAFGVRPGESPLAEGQKVIIEYENDNEATRRIARVSVYADEQLKAKVAVNDVGGYVPVARGRAAAVAQKRDTGEDEDQGGLSLYDALYETALKQGLSRPVVDELVKTFINDVDFQRSVQPGDSMVAFISDPDEFEPRPTLLYAALTMHDQTYRYYRFETPDDKVVDYYDESGRSSRKFLLRKPIAGGVMTSPFGMRFHPILHFARMHTGVDWGAPVGTPILAAGNGTVIEAAYDSGYGRRVEIQHANGYVTTYNHMSAFARGITEGVHVVQGQVVGYLGQSGLATGPHLHYEVIINGNFVDPMAIKLARTREFDGKLLAAFKKERDRSDQLMAQAPNAAATTGAGPMARVN